MFCRPAGVGHGLGNNMGGPGPEVGFVRALAQELYKSSSHADGEGIEFGIIKAALGGSGVKQWAPRLASANLSAGSSVGYLWPKLRAVLQAASNESGTMRTAAIDLKEHPWLHGLEGRERPGCISLRGLVWFQGENEQRSTSIFQNAMVLATDWPSYFERLVSAIRNETGVDRQPFAVVVGQSLPYPAQFHKHGVLYSVNASKMTQGGRAVRESQRAAVAHLASQASSGIAATLVELDDLTLNQKTTAFKEEVHLDIPGAEEAGMRFGRAMAGLIEQQIDTQCQHEKGQHHPAKGDGGHGHHEHASHSENRTHHEAKAQAG